MYKLNVKIILKRVKCNIQIRIKHEDYLYPEKNLKKVKFVAE